MIGRAIVEKLILQQTKYEMYKWSILLPCKETWSVLTPEFRVFDLSPATNILLLVFVFETLHHYHVFTTRSIQHISRQKMRWREKCHRKHLLNAGGVVLIIIIMNYPKQVQLDLLTCCWCLKKLFIYILKVIWLLEEWNGILSSTLNIW